MIPINQTEMEDLDFILDHLDEPFFPRAISTKATSGAQVVVNSKEETLSYFRKAGFTDCCLSAFAPNAKYTSFMFIDIDRNSFDTQEGLEIALKNTLNRIRQHFKSYPTVLYTGGGYHIYQPLKGEILEDIEGLNFIDNPSKEYLKFCSWYLSDKKADQNHNPTLKSCLLRIPNSINSKYGTRVEIIQRWNGFKPRVTDIIGSFALEMKCKQLREEQQVQSTRSYNFSSNRITWIERLLEIGIEDYRKHTIVLILAPYLLHVRKLSPNQTYTIISNWLDKCKDKRSLDFNTHSKIKEAIKTALRDNIPPMRLDTLKKNNKDLYDILNTKSR